MVPMIAPEIKAHGGAIEALRGSRRLSANKVALHIGVTRQFLRRVERGERGASLETLAALADALGVTIEAITYVDTP